jgi:hypothetical protein
MKFSKALLLVAVMAATTAALAAPPEHYLHVKVSNASTHELVRVNVPLSLAEKVIPAIHNGDLSNGKVHIGDLKTDDIDVRAILDALKTAPEGEFVTVQNNDNDVRVAKERGKLVVHVVDKGKKGQNVDVTIPWAVAEALIGNTTEHQLNIEAAIQALEATGDTTLVTVTGNEENVRIWIDSNNSDK